MGAWSAMEAGTVSVLAGLTGGGQPLLATVKGHTWDERRQLISAIERERMAAAYVMAAGREESDRTHRRAGEPTCTILYASRSERAVDEARIGGAGVVGVLTIAEAAAARLQDLDLGEGRRLLLVDERPLHSEPGMALWEQRYEVRLAGGTIPILFGGRAVLGERSEAVVEIGPLARASSRFAFPGVDGVFERFGGTRERTIVWRGQLRAEDDQAMTVLEEGLEALVGEGLVDAVGDPAGRWFQNCVPESFKRRGGRRRDAFNGETLQDFEMEVVQLLG